MDGRLVGKSTRWWYWQNKHHEFHSEADNDGRYGCLVLVSTDSVTQISCVVSLVYNSVTRQTAPCQFVWEIPSDEEEKLRSSGCVECGAAGFTARRPPAPLAACWLNAVRQTDHSLPVLLSVQLRACRMLSVEWLKQSINELALVENTVRYLHQNFCFKKKSKKSSSSQQLAHFSISWYYKAARVLECFFFFLHSLLSCQQRDLTSLTEQ